MKSQAIFLILALVLVVLSNASNANKNDNFLESKDAIERKPPQGADLNNHFGGSNVNSQYGPKPYDQYKQWVEANPDTFIPTKENPQVKTQINKNNIRSGEFTNIAPSASKIIKPEISVPKLKIEAEVNYPSEVHVPTFKGFKHEFHPVIAYDKETGKIIKDRVLINKPQYTLEKQVMNINHKHEETINLKTGERIKNKEAKALHGTKIKF